MIKKYVQRNFLFPLVLLSLLILQTEKIFCQQESFLKPIPELVEYVVDEIGLLTPQQKTELNTKLFNFADRFGSQVVIVIVDTTAPEVIEQYAIRLAEKYQIGRGGLDDGVLILVANQDRATRIEVGYGLEGAVSDIIAKRIIEGIILPSFRKNDFYTGLDIATDEIFSLIEAEALEPLAKKDADPVSTIAVLLLFACFVTAMTKLDIPKKMPVAAILGALGGGFLYGVFSIKGMLIGSVFGAIMSVMGLKGFLILISILSILAMLGNRSRQIGGQRGFSGRSFSGRGGSFGGGGASGRW